MLLELIVGCTIDVCYFPEAHTAGKHQQQLEKQLLEKPYLWEAGFDYAESLSDHHTDCITSCQYKNVDYFELPNYTHLTQVNLNDLIVFTALIWDQVIFELIGHSCDLCEGTGKRQSWR